MHFTLSLLAAVILAIQVNAQDFIAWSGNDCDGSEGLEVACDGTCFDFSNRHSFEVLNAEGFVTLFEGADCTGESFDFGAETPGECINVNTGTNIQSFICT
ncbi:hypothetical protein DFH07DRAFT_919668 [Mycena maculata]|uniref:Uncharacterized protein n=1 Tax=Mycena maculata TaxID=230809 RepID=A0AAD7J560_9AGAR|nr:hypothetical protein DFH07DRAFT_919668 [Mycena maculata]